MDYTNSQHIMPYMSLFNGVGKDNHDEGNDINREEYADGYTLYTFDLSPDLTDSESFSLARQGTVRMDMTFGEALANTITTVAYAEFENISEIDRNRNVVFDFTREIERFLEADAVCRGVFQGVFSADTLRDQPRPLVGYTDKSTIPGEHWIAIHVDTDGRGEYFDSFERAPNYHFEAYMNKHCTRWTCNRKQLESIISSFCGYYCCM